jgi:hypothetical protein
MPFPERQIHRLLSEQFDHIESIWDDDPYDAIKVYALTIKEFMYAHRIQDVEQGIASYLAFKQDQHRKLVALGLGSDDPEAAPSTPSRLALESA